MTPKEKAKELCNKFYNTDTHSNSVSVRMNIAGESALISVEEILKSFEGFMDSRRNFRHELEIDAERYWLAVKAEIEKM